MENMTKIKQMRLAYKMTQKQIAELVGVQTPTVNSLERKGIFDTRTAKKYAVAFKVNPIFLLDGLD